MCVHDEVIIEVPEDKADEVWIANLGIKDSD